jgi:hypothetical protein
MYEDVVGIESGLIRTNSIFVSELTCPCLMNIL